MEVMLTSDLTVQSSDYGFRYDMSSSIGNEAILGPSYIRNFHLIIPQQFLEAFQAKGFHVDSRHLNQSYTIDIDVGFPYNQENDDGDDHLTGFIRVRDASRFGILEILRESTAGDFKLKFDIDSLEKSKCSFSIAPITSSDFCTAKLLGAPNSQVFCCETLLMTNEMGVVRHWRESDTWSLTTSLVLLLPESLPVSDQLSTIRRMLTDEILCDATIVAKDGVEIKCHKNIVATHSPFLASFFARPGITSFKMMDKTEESVRAFLAYLYLWESSVPSEKAQVCVDLLDLGLTLWIKSLEQCMTRILLSRNSDWFEVDDAVRLFLLTYNIPRTADLSKKAAQVLKSKIAQLQTSPMYQEIFRKQPKAAMELCKYFAAV